jgi:hypothetical protein
MLLTLAHFLSAASETALLLALSRLKMSMPSPAC